MTDDNEKFLSRWSRLKQETKEQPPTSPQPAVPAADPKAPPPELPPLDQLTPDSDYRGFFHPKVDENLRRAALRKLFSDPHFNVMDGLDVYIDDYSKSDPIPAEMLARLKQAQKILDWAKEKKEEAQTQEARPLPADSKPALEDQALAQLPASPQTPKEAALESEQESLPQRSADQKA